MVTPGTRPHQAILALADQDRTHGPLQEQRQARPLVRTRLRGSNPEVYYITTVVQLMANEVNFILYLLLYMLSLQLIITASTTMGNGLRPSKRPPLRPRARRRRALRLQLRPLLTAHLRLPVVRLRRLRHLLRLLRQLRLPQAHLQLRHLLLLLPPVPRVHYLITVLLLFSNTEMSYIEYFYVRDCSCFGVRSTRLHGSLG